MFKLRNHFNFEILSYIIVFDENLCTSILSTEPALLKQY